MKKILTIIAAMVICDAYGEVVYWMVDNSVSSVSDCEANGNITKPSDPQKNGFRLVGWKEGDTDSFIAMYVTPNSSSYTPTSNTTNDTWTATFSWGTVTGKARCSSVSGTASCWNDSTGASCTTNANPTTTDTTPNNNVINYSGDTDKYCWCKMTNFADKSVSALAWVFYSANSSASNCASNCANGCGRNVQRFSGFRRAVFGVTQ